MPPVILRWGARSASIRERRIPGPSGRTVAVYIVTCGGEARQFERYHAAEVYAKRVIRPSLTR